MSPARAAVLWDVLVANVGQVVHTVEEAEIVVSWERVSRDGEKWLSNVRWLFIKWNLQVAWVLV